MAGINIVSFTPDKTGAAIDLQPTQFDTFSGLNELAGRVDGVGLVAASRAKRYPKGHGKTYSDREFTMVHHCAVPIHPARQILEALDKRGLLPAQPSCRSSPRHPNPSSQHRW